ncbi:hypothetical protein D3C81_620940 [compost metagenome]
MAENRQGCAGDMQVGPRADRHQRQACAAQPAKSDEDHHGDAQIEQQAGDEQGDRRIGQARGGNDLIGDATEYTHRRETAALRTVNHHQPHEHGIDAVLHGKVEGNRRKDGRHCRAQGAETGEQRRHHEHDPGYPGHMAANQQHRALDQPVDGAVVLGDAEQVSDADQG